MIKAGVLISGRYEIIGRIGTGGMADVYKAKDHKLNRNVAVKVLKREFREDELFVKKFKSEAQAAAGLMHPNIVNVYDVGDDRGLYYIVMELVEGITLKDYIQKKGRLTPKEVISITIQVCAGIEAAHDHQIVHRDIKPQNIIISKEGKVKVTDFGIAKATSSNTISTNAMGSVHYTSPEQARGGFSDAKSDIYSLGITMYEMITGRLPFDGETTVAIAIKHLQEEIVAPSEYIPDIPYSLERIILKCTQKSPDRRYANMDQLTKDLKHSLVDPEGDFVTIAPFANVADTVTITPEDLNRIQKGIEYDDENEYDDGEEDYDDSPYESKKQPVKKQKDRKKNSDVDPKMAKIMKILTVVVGVIIIFMMIFVIGKATGILRFGPKTETVTSDKAQVPYLVGKSKKEAEKLCKKEGLQLKVIKEEPSGKYDKGIVASQKTQSGTKVPKGTVVQVVLSSGLKADEIVMPDVTGMSEDDARRKLIKEGFDAEKITITTKQDDHVENGKVISTTPEAGEKTAEDTEIIIVISMGAEKAIVPELRGKTKTDAEAALANAGLLGSATEEYSDKPAGQVISQNTEYGKRVNKGATIGYVVSKGPKPAEKSVMPPIIGLYQSRAEQELRNVDLSVGSVTSEYSDQYAKGVVISASYREGDKLTPGTVVNLVVSKGPKPVETPPEQNPGEGEETGEQQ